MENELILKKRKRSSFSVHHPFMGIFTRSKSQIYLHRNRSGRAGSDSFRHSKHHSNLRSSPVGFLSKTRFESANNKRRQTVETVDDCSNIFIKDLRTRRVFSLRSMANDCVLCDDSEEKKGKRTEKTSGGIEDESTSDSINSEIINSVSFVDKEDLNTNCLDNKKVGDDTDILKSDMEFSSQEQSRTNSLVTEGNVKSCGDGEILTEECVLATPPEAEILHKLSIKTEGSLDNIDKKDANNSIPKSVLIKRSKVFKAPGSYSYRRLLPYLMDMVQDNLCKVDSNSIRTKSGDSVSRDALVSIDWSSDGTGSNLTYAQQIADSSMLICSQKDSCKMITSPTSLDDVFCPKQSADDVNEQIKIGVSCKDKNLECLNHDCSLKVHNPRINENISESKPPAGEESRTVVSSCACNGQDANDMSDYSGMAEKQPSCSIMQNGSVGIEASDLSLDCKTIDPNHVVSYVSGTEENSTKKEGDDNSLIDKIDDSNDKHTQMIPPDVDILGKPVVYQNVKGIKFVSQSTDQVLGKPLSGSSHKSNSYLSDKRMDSGPKRKLGINPCSQLMLFKTRSSLSYKRLLPYLMDIAKDNSGDSRNGHSPKFENGVDENLVSSLSRSDLDETLPQRLNENIFHLEHNTNSCTAKMAKPATSFASGCNQSSLVPSGHKNEISASVLMEQEPKFQVMELISDNEGQSSAAPAIVNFAHGSSPDTWTSCSSVSPKSFAGDILHLALHESPSNNIEDSRTSASKLINAAKPDKACSSSQNSFKLEASGPLQIDANGSKKGILKRTTRGCRGPCTCLNCASFRLHAERAFQFSKNQMQVAEEVASDLIKELSYLRNMLDKAASGCKDNLVIHINQVKEACRKASEAEEPAKSRLSQMNYDLEVHCRITDGQRPRVKFANNIEERIIS